MKKAKQSYVELAEQDKQKKESKILRGIKGSKDKIAAMMFSKRQGV